MTVRYDYASRCTGAPAPGAVALEQAILARWSHAGAGTAGIYNCRPVRGGSTMSIHSEGRAIDITFPGSGNPAGDRLAAELLASAQALQVQQIIWNRRSIRPGGTWRPYNGVNPHTDHLHIELNRDGAQALTRDRAAAALDGSNTGDDPMTDGGSFWDSVRRERDATPATRSQLQEVWAEVEATGARANRSSARGQESWVEHMLEVGASVEAARRNLTDAEEVPGRGGFLPGIPNPLDPLAAIARMITDPEVWLRVVATLLGSGLLLVGVGVVARSQGAAIPRPPIPGG